MWEEILVHSETQFTYKENERAQSWAHRCHSTSLCLVSQSMTLLKDLGKQIESLSLKPRPFLWLNPGPTHGVECPPCGDAACGSLGNVWWQPSGCSTSRLVIQSEKAHQRTLFFICPECTLSNQELSCIFQKSESIVQRKRLRF